MKDKLNQVVPLAVIERLSLHQTVVLAACLQACGIGASSINVIRNTANTFYKDDCDGSKVSRQSIWNALRELGRKGLILLPNGTIRTATVMLSHTSVKFFYSNSKTKPK